MKSNQKSSSNKTKILYVLETVKKAKNNIYKYYWHFSINTYLKKVLQLIQTSNLDYLVSNLGKSFSHSDFSNVTNIVVLLLTFLGTSKE